MELKLLPSSSYCLLLLLLLLSSSSLGLAISSCGGPCDTSHDCHGKLLCIQSMCNDDINADVYLCSTPSSVDTLSNSNDTCQQSGTLVCQGQTYPTYQCSPPVTASTSAILTHNDFSKGGDAGGPSKCDEKYHENSEPVAALSTGWYGGGSRCGSMIRVNANGQSVTAKVVDECDSMNGCDKEHAYLAPCGNNVVDASDAVWNALGLDINDGRVPITWSMA